MIEMIYAALPDCPGVVRVPRSEVDMANYEIFVDEPNDRVVWVHSSRICEFFTPHLIIGDMEDVRARWEC